jgi:hypothetical protein
VYVAAAVLPAPCVQPAHNTCDMDVPCFAMELEQDIARLEAEADG